MTREEVGRLVFDVLSTVLKKKIDRDLDITRQNTEEWDSLKHMEIMFALEDSIGIEFTEDELVNLDSFEKIVEVILSRHAA